MSKKLSMHITDTVEKIDLKIYEEDSEDETIFVFEILNIKDDSKIILRMTEKNAAILYEGLNNLFIEDDTEYQYDTDKEKEYEENPLEDFFKNLKYTDSEHFGFEEEEDDEEED